MVNLHQQCHSQQSTRIELIQLRFFRMIVSNLSLSLSQVFFICILNFLYFCLTNLLWIGDNHLWIIFIKLVLNIFLSFYIRNKDLSLIYFNYSDMSNHVLTISQLCHRRYQYNS